MNCSLDFEATTQTGDNFLHFLFNNSLYEENAVQLLEDRFCGKFSFAIDARGGGGGGEGGAALGRA